MSDSFDNSIADPLVENVVSDDVAAAPVRLEATPEGVATVTLARPERKNAFDQAVIAALTEAFETLQGADHVRVVFLRGEGGSFCAGADLEWMRAAAGWTEDENRDDAMALAVMLKALHDIPALTVALVEGAAFGGGAGLVAACDMAVGVRDARFAFSEVKLGLTPATISPYVINAIGPRCAKAKFASGRVFDAAEAHRIGLLTEIVGDAGGLEAAREALARDMTLCAPGAVAEAKRLVEDVNGRDIDRKLMDDTAKRIAARRVSPEGREGVAAFLERRRPSWATMEG